MYIKGIPSTEGMENVSYSIEILLENFRKEGRYFIIDSITVIKGLYEFLETLTPYYPEYLLNFLMQHNEGKCY